MLLHVQIKPSHIPCTYSLCIELFWKKIGPRRLSKFDNAAFVFTSIFSSSPPSSPHVSLRCVALRWVALRWVALRCVALRCVASNTSSAAVTHMLNTLSVTIRLISAFFFLFVCMRCHVGPCRFVAALMGLCRMKELLEREDGERRVAAEVSKQSLHHCGGEEAKS